MEEAISDVRKLAHRWYAESEAFEPGDERNCHFSLGGRGVLCAAVDWCERKYQIRAYFEKIYPTPSCVYRIEVDGDFRDFSIYPEQSVGQVVSKINEVFLSLTEEPTP